MLSEKKRLKFATTKQSLVKNTSVRLSAALVLALGAGCLGTAANAAIDASITPTPTIEGISGAPSGTPSGPVNTSIGTVFIGTNFTGTTIAQSGFIPPDTMGAVGPNHIVELINGRYAIYDRAGTFQSATSLDSFWSNAGVGFNSFTFDPRLIYDPSSSRWYAAAVDNPGSANNILLAVSNNSDPTSGWSGFAVDSDAADTRWADFPMLGLTGDRVTVTANMFGISGATTANVSVYSVAKNDLIAGTS